MSLINPLRRSLAAAFSLLPLATLAKPWRAAPALLLAQEAAPDIDPSVYLVSEKYDGVRAYWDGHTLRFRSGITIAAPAWFEARLPAFALDGELWLGRGRFEELSGGLRRQQPDEALWRELRYMVFELPGSAGTFAQRAARLQTLTDGLLWPQLVAVPQHVVASREALQARLQAVVRAGGEGLMLHRADAPYATCRQGALLKLKPEQDAEAVVLGYESGRGKHAGRMGALRVRTPQGVEFALGTGFSDAQRAQPPAPGTVVTYTYRGLTSQGVPRFASFLRVRGAV